MSFNTDTLESMCELIVDCPHSTPEWTDSGVIVLRNQNIKNGNLDLSSPSYTTQKDFEGRIKRAEPTEGDIVLTREAPMGEVCRIPKGIKCCLGQRQVLLRPKKEIDGDYLFWAIQSSYVQNQIAWSEGTGSTVSNLRIPLIKALKIPRFHESEKSIGKMLNGLWKKIHLNTQTNQTLESIAQAIFKSWFVDFDPVKAKMAAIESLTPTLSQQEREQKVLRAAMGAISGKGETELAQLQQQNPEHYQQLAETAALFPNAMVESELGEIPEGWDISSVEQQYKVEMGQSPKGESYNENGDGTLFYQGRAEFGTRFPTPRLFTTEPKKFASRGDILMSVRAPVGDLNIANNPCCIGRGLAALNHKLGGTSFAYYELKSLHHIFDRFNGEGTVFGSINQKDLKSISVIKPSAEIVYQFRQAVENIDKQIYVNTSENISLAQLRDSLLPKLLSGEIDLSESALTLALSQGERELESANG